MFWVTDNFLMHRSVNNRRPSRRSYNNSLLRQVKVRYRAIKNKNKVEESESDELVSADEELLGSFENLQQRPSINATVT